MTTPNTATPLTDALLNDCVRTCPICFDKVASFARSLETQPAELRAKADAMAVEMERYLPVLQKLQDQLPAAWDSCTHGTGIATVNGYRHALTAYHQPTKEKS